MEYRLLGTDLKQKYRDEMLQMLVSSDQEFVPPLSSRASTTQADLSGTVVCEKGVLPYFEQMCSQRILGAFEGDALVGIVSFKEDYVGEHIPEEEKPNIYISTLLLKPETRGKGLTAHMYAFLFETCYPRCKVFTRTWSTNAAHIRILEKFGFQQICCLENDRGAGIHTVYFRRDAIQ